MRAFQFLLIALLVFLSGCVTNQPAVKDGLVISMDANPRSVFAGGTTTITMDVENMDSKTLKGVAADVFETGMFDYADREKCRKSFGDMEPQDFKTFACNLVAKATDRTVDNTVWARVKFSSALAAVQTIDILSQAELETRLKTARATEAQKSFSFRDSNLQVEIDFSDAPIVVSSRKEYVSFAIKNVGIGFIEKLRKDDVKITGKNAKLECQQQDMYISGREFPRFSCEISPLSMIDSFITADVSININYDYEMRSSVAATIV